MKKIDNLSASKISAEFDEFEKHLFEKYALKPTNKDTDINHTEDLLLPLISRKMTRAIS